MHDRSAHVVRALRLAFPGRVASGRALGRFRTDFGGQVARTPLAAVAVHGEKDVVAAFEIATRFGVPCRVRGAGHSCGGQALVEGGIVLAHRANHAEPVTIHGDGSLETTARNRWTWVDRAARRAGRIVPVLGDWLPLSVGGTLSVGGYGVRSLAAGGQVNQVLRLRLVLPTGRALWCSPEEDGDLFRHSLAGLGGLGVIERVTLRTERRRAWIVMRTYRAPPVGEVGDALASLAWTGGTPPDMFYYTGKRDRFVVGYAADSRSAARTLGHSDAFGAFGAFRVTSTFVVPNLPHYSHLGVAAWLLRFHGHVRVWSDFVLPAPAMPAFMRFVEDLRGSGAFAGHLRTVYLLGIRSPLAGPTIPLAPTGNPQHDTAFGVGLYCMVPRGRPEALATVRLAQRHCLERCVALGGRPYLYGWHELDEPLMRRAYGSTLDTWRTLKQAHDPAGIVPSIFTGP